MLEATASLLSWAVSRQSKFKTQNGDFHFKHDRYAHSAHTGSGWGLDFLMSVAGWWNNIYARFQVHSCFDSQDIKWRFGNTVQIQLYIRTSIIWTRDTKKMQGQSTHCDHMTGLCMHSKPTLRSCHVRISCCAAIKSSSNAQRSKRNAR